MVRMTGIEPATVINEVELKPNLDEYDHILITRIL